MINPLYGTRKPQDQPALTELLLKEELELFQLTAKPYLENINKQSNMNYDYQQASVGFSIEFENDLVVIKDDYQRFFNIKGLLHRDNDLPAVVGKQNKWYQNGLLHRDSKPAVVSFGSKMWFQHGKLHRIGAPAIEGTTTEWYENGLRHRFDAPAVVSAHAKEFFVRGIAHRLDGPAFDTGGPQDKYFIAGNPINPQKFLQAADDYRFNCKRITDLWETGYLFVAANDLDL